MNNHTDSESYERKLMQLEMANAHLIDLIVELCNEFMEVKKDGGFKYEIKSLSNRVNKVLGL